MSIFQRKHRKATISFIKKINLLKVSISDDMIIAAIITAVDQFQGVKIVDINLSKCPKSITIKHEKDVDPFKVADAFVINLPHDSLCNIRVYKGGRKWRLKKLK